MTSHTTTTSIRETESPRPHQHAVSRATPRITTKQPIIGIMTLPLQPRVDTSRHRDSFDPACLRDYDLTSFMAWIIIGRVNPSVRPDNLHYAGLVILAAQHAAARALVSGVQNGEWFKVGCFAARMRTSAFVADMWHIVAVWLGR